MKKIKRTISYFLIIFIALCGISYTYFESNIIGRTHSYKETNTINNVVQVSFLDVGQADSILIQIQDKYMLIDAGNNKDGEKLTKYFLSLGIDKFEYVIGTHAHEDHIGGMDNIIDNFIIDKFYMPDVVTTTVTFEEVLDSLEKMQVSFETPVIDSTFKVNQAIFTVLYVGTDEDDLNNTSIVLKMEYGSKTFLFMGDATEKIESKISNKDIKSDVIKIGHHGSEYSTTDKFIAKVLPEIAIIEVGKNNLYNHPKDITIDKLNKINTRIYRTDQDSTIIVNTDGKTIKIKTIETDING